MAERTIPYEPGLDGLRALCITGVLLFHVFALAGYDGWVRGGGLGVSVFFTLSGFLITALLVTEHASTGGIRLWRFWGRRVQRPRNTAGRTSRPVPSVRESLVGRFPAIVLPRYQGHSPPGGAMLTARSS